jgi:WD40 repeat protein
MGVTHVVEVSHPESDKVLNGCGMFIGAFFPDGQFLMAAHGGTMALWNVAQAKKLQTVETGGQIGRLTFTADGRRILCGVKPLTMWDAHSLTRLWEGSGEWNAYFSHDGKQIISGRKTLLDAEDGKEMSAYPLPMLERTAIAPDGKLGIPVRAAYGGLPLSVFDMARAEELDRFKDPKLPSFVSVTWSPDGRWILIGCVDGTMRLIEAKTGKQILSYGGMVGSVWAVAISIDAKFAASVCNDPRVRVFSLPQH